MATRRTVDCGYKSCLGCVINYFGMNTAINMEIQKHLTLGFDIQCITRSTPRAQTSATPSLKSVKQSTQVWNNVVYCFLCPYPENFMNVHPSGITWRCQQAQTQEIEKKKLCVQGVKPIIPQMFQIVSCVIANTSCKFHENPLIDFTVVLLTNT